MLTSLTTSLIASTIFLRMFPLVSLASNIASFFLVDLFEKISTINNYENVNLEVPISAAMAIITNTSWHQPTEAQIEYDFTRECIDKGIYEFGQIDEFDDLILS